jgi:nicotinate-nucleotide pyrophosphorylase (carboxylating)
MISPHPLVWQDIVTLALREDMGHRGDLTSRSIFGPADQCHGKFVARRDGVISGLDVVRHVLNQCDSTLKFTQSCTDGDSVAAGQIIASVEGAAISVLEAERTALNFLSHLSGIATMTKSYADLIADTKAQLCCTRKTTPGLRVLEKYAVACGGGVNHRFGLNDAILIKDNHIAVAGGVVPAIGRAKKAIGHMVKIEVEVETFDQLRLALEQGIDAVLLDNWLVQDLPEAVAMIGGCVISEASGGITRDTLRAVAETGVDLISVGALTHSAPVLDVGLDIS